MSDKPIFYEPDKHGLEAAQEALDSGSENVAAIVDAYIQNLSDRGRLHLIRQLLYPGYK